MTAPRPHYLQRIDERTRRRLERINAGVSLLEVLGYAAAICIGLALSAAWPMGFAS